MKLVPTEEPISKKFSEAIFKYCHCVMREDGTLLPKYLRDARLMILINAILYLVQVTVLAEMEVQGIDKFKF
jgi:hypothetical protein